MSAALLQGTLTAGTDGCVYIDATLLIWPAGFTAVGSPATGLTILDPDGREVARTGDVVDVQGGFGDRAPFPAAAHCTTRPDSSVFFGGLSATADGSSTATETSG